MKNGNGYQKHFKKRKLNITLYDYLTRRWIIVVAIKFRILIDGKKIDQWLSEIKTIDVRTCYMLYYHLGAIKHEGRPAGSLVVDGCWGQPDRCHHCRGATHRWPGRTLVLCVKLHFVFNHFIENSSWIQIFLLGFLVCFY